MTPIHRIAYLVLVVGHMLITFRAWAEARTATTLAVAIVPELIILGAYAWIAIERGPHKPRKGNFWNSRNSGNFEARWRLRLPWERRWRSTWADFIDWG